MAIVIPLVLLQLLLPLPLLLLHTTATITTATATSIDDHHHHDDDGDVNDNNENIINNNARCVLFWVLTNTRQTGNCNHTPMYAYTSMNCIIIWPNHVLVLLLVAMLTVTDYHTGFEGSNRRRLANVGRKRASELFGMTGNNIIM